MRTPFATLPAPRRVLAVLLLWAAVAVAAATPISSPGSTGSTGAARGASAHLGSSGLDDHAFRLTPAQALWSGARQAGGGTLLQPAGAHADDSFAAPHLAAAVAASTAAAPTPDLRLDAVQGRAPPLSARA